MTLLSKYLDIVCQLHIAVVSVKKNNNELQRIDTKITKSEKEILYQRKSKFSDSTVIAVVLHADG